MKIQTNLVNIVLKSFLSLMLAAPLFSCTNLDEVWEKFEEEDARLDSLEDRLDSLESSLNNQIKALDEILSGSVTISECKKNNDGSTTIILTDETSFTVYPKSADYSTLLTYVEEGGVKYWAFYDAKGKVAVMKDKDGNKIPVEAELPVVEEVDGEFILSIGGNEYTTGYTPEDVVTVFSDYELNMDESGNVYSVTFTFGEDMTFTISVADYKGISFHMIGDVNEKVIKDYYVGFSTTKRLKVKKEGVVDYVMQVPDGWRVKEVVDDYTGEAFMDVTAPTETLIAGGAAVASGELKVVAVLENGKSMVAKLELSALPFKKFTATSTNAVIEKYNGVDKVLYGLSVFSSYDADAIIAGAEDMIADNGKGVTDSNVNTPLSTLLGSELTTGERYVLWALPVFYVEEDKSAVWDVDPELLMEYQFGAITASVTVNDEDILFNDVTVSVKLAGFKAFYGGTAVMTDNTLSEILYEINNGQIDPYTEPMTYTGSAFKFPTAAANTGLEILSEETYLTWIVPVEDGKDVYSVDDVVYKSYTLPSVTSGGAIEVVAGTSVVDRVSIKVPLTAEGASRIYYAFLTKRSASRYGTDEAKVDYLLNNGEIADGASVNAAINKLDPETSMTLFAMATDAKGKYGKVSVYEYTTDELEYNNLSVSLKVENVGQDNAAISVAVKGGTPTKYVYWAGRNTEAFWTDLGANDTDRRSAAQKFLALYPEDDVITRVMNKYPMVDGVIQMTDLTGEATYNVVVLAQDASGNYSMAGISTFTTLAVDLGTIVTSETATWATAKSSITITYIPESYSSGGGEFAGYNFSYQGPTDMTAYIVAGHIENFEGRGYNLTLPEQILEIRDYASRPLDGSKYIGDQEEKWYDDNGVEHAGNMVDHITFGIHGLASKGAVTYFSPAHHDLSNCEACDERVNNPKETTDRSYEGIQATIHAKTTLEYWIEYSKIRYGITNETYLNQTAQGLLDLYYDYYKDLEPVIYINDGTPLRVEQRQGWGPDEQGVVKDAVIVVLRDSNDNYYEPMFFPVENHWN